MTRAFWTSAAIIAYVYVGYPALLWVWAHIRSGIRRGGPVGPPRTGLKAGPYVRPGADERHGVDAEFPGVSIIIAARNEAARLPSRIENLLSLEYPGPRQIIIVSDGSTDHTVNTLRTYEPDVEAVLLPPSGKAAALNAGVERARHDIIVFADARQRFASDALLELVRPLDDPSVGAVGGELFFDADSEERSTIGEGVGLYWRYEKQIRRLEATVASTVGASGAIYAVRRSLWQPLPPDTILDDVLTPLRVAMAGYRVVFADRARAYDQATRDSAAEARRKIRTLAGNYQLLALEPRLILPWVNPVWLQYVSHKLGRLIVPYLLLVVFASSLALAEQSLFFEIVMSAQVAFYLMAGCGAVLELTRRKGWSVRIAHTFVMMNYAAVVALVVAVRGRKVWR